jgi:ribosomal protein L6P/L9E
MTPINTTHPFQPNKINTWFEHNILSMNVPYACNSNKRDLVVTLLEAQFKGNFYFHATSWNYAQNIINGIQSGFGRRLDFGYNPSFYISNSLQLALEFGQKSQQRHFQEIAILVFYYLIASLPTFVIKN